jgi:hypothetical protein
MPWLSIAGLFAVPAAAAVMIITTPSPPWQAARPQTQAPAR